MLQCISFAAIIVKYTCVYPCELYILNQYITDDSSDIWVDMLAVPYTHIDNTGPETVVYKWRIWLCMGKICLVKV